MTITIRTIDGHVIRASGDHEFIDGIMFLIEVGQGELIKIKQSGMMHWVYRRHIASITLSDDK